MDVERPLEPGLGEHQIVVHVGQLLLQGDHRLVDGEGLTEIVGQHQHRLTGPVRVGETQAGDGVQSIEQKVGVDLRL